MYFNTLILDYFHYISAITEIFKKQNYVWKKISSLTLLVTFDQRLVYRVGTVRGSSLKMRKWIYITLHKFISQYLIYEYKIFWKSKSNIPFFPMKIYHDNLLGNHDVPTRQNVCNWTFSSKGTSLFPTWMYFSMYNNVLQSKWETKAIQVDVLCLCHHDLWKIVPTRQYLFYGHFAP